MDKKAHDFINVIYDYFKTNSRLGRIKTISTMEPLGNKMRFHVKCTKKREYIVYEKDGKIFNVGIYKKELV